MAIILRSSKSVPLTFTEMDGNFSELNARATTLEGAHIKNVNGVTTSSAQDNAITLDTDDITEGSTNQYFTNARSRSAISITDAGGDGSLSYNSSTGVITYTGPSAAEVRAHISATSATGVTYTEGTGVIALASIPNSSLTNNTITFAGDSGSQAITLGDTLTFVGGDGVTTTKDGANNLTIDITADGINDTHIDFGTGANQVSTADIPEQTNLYYTDVRADARIAAANLTDLNDVSYSSPTTNHVLTWTGSGWQPAEAPGATGGEANRVANVGGYNELFKNKAGVVLNFRTIDHGDNLSITQSTDTLTINTVAAPEFGNIKIGGNSIENIATNSNIALVPNGTGVVTIDSDLLPASDSSYDLGASGTEWANAYIDDVTATNLTGTIQTGAQPNIVSVGSQTANLNMNNNKILNVTDPTLAQDAATKAYVDAQLQTQDTLQEITDNGATTTNTITANGFTTDGLTVTDNNIQTTRSNDNIVMLPNGTGVVEMRSAVAMSANAITGVADPSSAQDAATKAYVDSALSSGTTIFTLQADSGSNDAVLTGDTIDFEGTANEIETAVSDSKITIGLPTNVSVSNDLTVGNTLTVTGNLTVNGTTTTVSSSELAIDDGKIQLAVNNESSDTVDIGFIGHYNNGVRRAHAGLFRDATDKKFKLMGDYGPEPDQLTIDTDDANFALADLVLRSLEIGDTDNPSMAIRGSRLETINSNQNIELETSGTGIVDIGADVQLKAQADLRFADSDSSNYVAFQAPATIASNVTWTLPDDDASVSGYALVSDAAGVLSWAAAGATVTQDNSSNTDFNLYYASTTSGALTAVKYDGADLLFNPSTSTLTCTNFAGVATSAQYADLAEIYTPDVDYSPGTVVTIGGTQEITAANHNTQYLAGVISTAPAYLMNSAAEGEAVALVGRVPVRVVGAVNKGQAVFAADGGVAKADATGPIVGIALESSSNTAEKLIECLLKV